MFQTSRQHIALLLDEFGGFEGVVTLEDLIEEIVGDIEDEHDVLPVVGIQQVAEDEYIVPGNYSVYDFNTEFHVNIESRESDTVAGYFIEEIGSFDDLEDEVVHVEHLELRTEEIEEHRILTLRVKVLPIPEVDEDAEDED